MERRKLGYEAVPRFDSSAQAFGGVGELGSASFASAFD